MRFAQLLIKRSIFIGAGHLLLLAAANAQMLGGDNQAQRLPNPRTLGELMRVKTVFGMSWQDACHHSDQPWSTSAILLLALNPMQDALDAAKNGELNLIKAKTTVGLSCAGSAAEVGAPWPGAGIGGDVLEGSCSKFNETLRYRYAALYNWTIRMQMEDKQRQRCALTRIYPLISSATDLDSFNSMKWP